MTIATLTKISIVGRAAQQNQVLQRLQAMNAVHLLPLTPPETHPEKRISREAEDAYTALRFLAVVPRPRRQLRADPTFDIADFVTQSLTLRANLRTARDLAETLRARLAALQPWGDFQLPAPEELGGIHLWFYEVPVRDRAQLAEIDLPWQIVGADTRTLYVVVLAEEEPPESLLPVPRSHLGASAIRDLKVELDSVEIRIEDLQAERLALTRYLTLLRASLSEAETLAELAYANAQVRKEEHIFALQGWLPESRLPEVKRLADEMGLALLGAGPAKHETPPTLLEQPEQASAGVDLALFYQVPHYRSWDPTLYLIIAFAVFFAMILADAGYGLLLLVGVIATWRRLSGSARARGWRRLGLVLSLSTIAYGVIVGSYFGLSPPAGTGVLNSLAFLDLNDFSTMMRLSIVIGVLHLVLANVMAFRANPGRSRWASVGWCGILFGGLLIWLSSQSGPLFGIGTTIGALGIAALVGFSSERPLQKPLDAVWRVLDGAKEITGLMGLFGDVLSYMRLFALGLASASLALTFNSLAMDAMDSRSGLGMLGGLLILAIGHGLNLGLALMSGVVHGLRLNYIEFYKWGLPEEGVAFRAFARKEVRE